MSARFRDLHPQTWEGALRAALSIAGRTGRKQRVYKHEFYGWTWEQA